ncbi:MAG: low-specificity L-threonine aldolase [Planctomycetota bacterium]
MIDLRSDTITVPSTQMRQAMAEADVGDDVFGEDPTVNALEKLTAEFLGKEASVFVPSGTMSNEIAIRAQTAPGNEIILDAKAHCYLYEGGAPAALSGVTCRLINGTRGIFTAQDVKAVLRPKNYHFPPAKLLCLENTHNQGGGSIWPLELIADVTSVARDANLDLHLDGARLWNASIATGIPEKEYAKYFDSINVCFSKGLGAPVGSALAGSAELIDRARRFRKQFGGGMRQAGIIAAGALYALENNRDRLTEDHNNAKQLASGIAGLPGIKIDVKDVETNIVFFKIDSMPAKELAGKLQKNGVYVLALGPDIIRTVTHLNVSNEQIIDTIDIFKKILVK